MWTLDPYVFKASSEGLKIFDLASESLVHLAEFTGGINSVWANNQYVYVATTSSGIYKTQLATVTGTMVFEPYKSYPNITNNCVNYIHGNGDYLLAATLSGIDRYNTLTDTREYSLIENLDKCFQTTGGDYYYTKNPDFVITGLDDSVFNWSYCKVVTLSHAIFEDNYQFYFEIPLTRLGLYDDVYLQSYGEGEDIRIIDNIGRSVPYFIESWDFLNPPKIWTKLYKDTTMFYVVYGNRSVLSVSSAEDTFRFFEHFDGTELSDKWVWNNGGSESDYYTVSNSTFRFNLNTNTSVSLSSYEPFAGGVLEYYGRKIDSTYNEDLDWSARFLGSTVASIGVDDNEHETPHFLVGAVGTVYGTKLLSSSWKVHKVIESENVQFSEYDGELLTSSGTISVDYRTIRFSCGSSANEPDFELDWVRLRNYDPDPPSYVVSAGDSIYNVFVPAELHAIYEAGGQYVYTCQQSTINASNINDLFITENTSIYGGNVIFLATNFGAYVIEEKRADEENCRKKIYLIET